MVLPERKTLHTEINHIVGVLYSNNLITYRELGKIRKRYNKLVKQENNNE